MSAKKRPISNFVSIADKEDKEEQRKRLKRGQRFSSSVSSLSPPPSSPAVSLSLSLSSLPTKKPRRTATLSSKENKDQDPETDKHDKKENSFVGTSRSLMKQFYRLTGAPHEINPETVRPLSILRISLAHMKKQWIEKRNYSMVQEQLKCIRQDLLIQGYLHGDFVTHVYETNGRVAIEAGELRDFGEVISRITELQEEQGTEVMDEMFFYLKKNRRKNGQEMLEENIWDKGRMRGQEEGKGKTENRRQGRAGGGGQQFTKEKEDETNKEKKDNANFLYWCERQKKLNAKQSEFLGYRILYALYNSSDSSPLKLSGRQPFDAFLNEIQDILRHCRQRRKDGVQLLYTWPVQYALRVVNSVINGQWSTFFKLYRMKNSPHLSIYFLDFLLLRVRKQLLFNIKLSFTKTRATSSPSSPSPSLQSSSSSSLLKTTSPSLDQFFSIDVDMETIASWLQFDSEKETIQFIEKFYPQLLVNTPSSLACSPSPPLKEKDKEGPEGKRNEEGQSKKDKRDKSFKQEKKKRKEKEKEKKEKKRKKNKKEKKEKKEKDEKKEKKKPK